MTHSTKQYLTGTCSSSQNKLFRVVVDDSDDECHNLQAHSRNTQPIKPSTCFCHHMSCVLQLHCSTSYHHGYGAAVCDVSSTVVIGICATLCKWSFCLVHMSLNGCVRLLIKFACAVWLPVQPRPSLWWRRNDMYAKFGRSSVMFCRAHKRWQHLVIGPTTGLYVASWIQDDEASVTVEAVVSRLPKVHSTIQPEFNNVSWRWSHGITAHAHGGRFPISLVSLRSHSI